MVFAKIVRDVVELLQSKLKGSVTDGTVSLRLHQELYILKFSKYEKGGVQHE